MAEGLRMRIGRDMPERAAKGKGQHGPPVKDGDAGAGARREGAYICRGNGVAAPLAVILRALPSHAPATRVRANSRRAPVAKRQ